MHSITLHQEHERARLKSKFKSKRPSGVMTMTRAVGGRDEEAEAQGGREGEVRITPDHDSMCIRA